MQDQYASPSAVAVHAPVPFRVHWGPLIAGAVAALAVWVLLWALGLALGLSTLDPEDSWTPRAAGIFAGIWGVINPVLSLLAGGFVASRTSGPLERSDGALNGLLVWSLATLAGTFMVVSLLSGVVGGAVSLGKDAIAGTGAAVGAMAGGAGDMGIDANAALGPVNARLAAQGKPAITASQLQSAVKDVVVTAVRTGNLDRATLTRSVAEQTALSQADAEQVAEQVEQQVSALRARASSAVDATQTRALQAADATGKAFWGIFGALLLGLAAAVGGSLLGVTRRQRAWAEANVDGNAPLSPSAPPLRPSEVVR